jgi:ubiquinone/menaquinone biosynthesis C-methylase UbiE
MVGLDGQNIEHYDAQYRNFHKELLAKIRKEAFGEDIGQTGWLTRAEQDQFIDWLLLGRGSHVLDIACGSGRPALRLASQTGCRVTGIDLHSDGVKAATKAAQDAGLEEKTEFLVADASKELAFDAGSFDVVMCIDAINHLPNREEVLAGWFRILRPGGPILFTDPIVVTGPLTNEEIAIRASIGFFLFVPRDTDERMLERVGFQVQRIIDSTANMATNARGWLAARDKREVSLRKLEGDELYEGQQRFFETAATLAEQKRLSRLTFLAKKPA